MPRIHTHYDNLKVARNAPAEVIRAAYKTLSQKYHPDRNPGPDAVRVIQIINSAYEVLSDPVKRQEHDDWIAREEAQEKKGTISSPTSAKQPSRGHSRRSGRHRSASHVRSHRAGHAFFSGKVFQKMWLMLNNFSRQLFRKT
jgi:DnaJ-class molecular chaperone